MQPAALPRRAFRRARRRRRSRRPRPSRRRAARREQIISIGVMHADQRGSRCVPPQPGTMPILTSGRRDLGVRRVRTRCRSSIARTSSVPPPMQLPSISATVGKRQAADAAEQLVAEFDALSTPVPSADSQRAEFVQVGPGDELAGLAARNSNPAGRSGLRAVRPARPAPPSTALPERVDLLVGQVERDEGDLAVRSSSSVNALAMTLCPSE